jgi:hypothetical protein
MSYTKSGPFFQAQNCINKINFNPNTQGLNFHDAYCICILAIKEEGLLLKDIAVLLRGVHMTIPP